MNGYVEGNLGKMVDCKSCGSEHTFYSPCIVCKCSTHHAKEVACPIGEYEPVEDALIEIDRLFCEYADTDMDSFDLATEVASVMNLWEEDLSVPVWLLKRARKFLGPIGASGSEYNGGKRIKQSHR